MLETDHIPDADTFSSPVQLRNAYNVTVSSYGRDHRGAPCIIGAADVLGEQVINAVALGEGGKDMEEVAGGCSKGLFGVEEPL